MTPLTPATVSAATAEHAADLHETKRYQRLKLTASLCGMILNLLTLSTLALIFAPWVDSWVRQAVGTNPWLRLVLLGFGYACILELVSQPLDFWSGYVLEHRYHLSKQTVGGWIWRQIKGYLIGGPLGLALLVGLYALLWFAGAWWWVIAAAGWLAVTLLLGQLLPVVILPLFYKVTRLEDSTLLERLRRRADGTGLRVEGIYRLHLSAETSKANAALAGMGRTRRVLLGDTLLDEFTPDEIEVVFAHEVGHHVYRHLVKMIVLSVVLATVGLWLVNRVLQYGTPALGYVGTESLQPYQDPSALPLLLLVLAVFALVLSPLQNAISRRYERQCDRYALEQTGMVQAYRSAFDKLARMNKADPDPHPVVVWLFDDHPPIRERLAMADGYDPLPTPASLS